MRNVAILLLTGVLSAGAAAQANPPAAKRSQTTAPAPMASVQPGAGIDPATIAQLNKVVENARVDLAALRIDKWKTDSSVKRQAESNAESLQRNMTSALPVIVSEVRANPASVAAAFKLYRNVNALYEVLASLTESAGAFGPKDEYKTIATDTQNVDDLRRNLGDQFQLLANARDQQVTMLEARARQAAESAPPKKIIVDESAPVKPAKKTAKKHSKAQPATSASESPAQSPPK